MSYNPNSATGQLPPATTITSGQSPYTALATDNVIECNTVGGVISVVLPVAGITAGKVYNIKKINALNTVTITVTGGASIDGAANLIQAALNLNTQVYYDGTNYLIL